jgi:cobyric acid synthase CobQ/L-threonine-O-3-phosphate decarboxylase
MASHDTDNTLSEFEHGGNIHKLMRDGRIDAGRYIDFSANINPIGPPAWLRSEINRELEMLAHYPDPDYLEIRQLISDIYGVDRDGVVVTNGSSELLSLLPLVIPERKIVIPVPCYVDYLGVFGHHDMNILQVPLAEQNGFSITAEGLETYLTGNDAVIFGNPANPTGSFIEDDAILNLASRHPETLFIVDEAFHEFVSEFGTVGGKHENIITLNSLTKFFGIPGLRAGFGLFPRAYASRVTSFLPRWSVNALAASVSRRALEDRKYNRQSREACAQLRKQLRNEIERIDGLCVYDSKANYLLVKLETGTDAEELYTRLLRRNIIVRRCSNYPGLGPNYFRLAVRSESDNDRLVRELRKIMQPGRGSLPGKTSQRRAKSLMFQGTSSNAGKSIMAAAFCRIFVQDGLQVAPFKAQNMSLNSHVTRDGREMGRAQVVQAAAAKIDPDYRMNPVLLKPNSDTGSQVIIRGRPVGNMQVRQYHAYKSTAWEAVTRSYDELACSYDVLVLEGAGSPGEINLKSHDIVNMKMAAYAGAPVLLVGDIDRGGVYASFAGTMDVLEEWERKLISGFIVNKFRGDASLLDDAHEFLANHTGRDVYGVVPYLTNMAIPQEDSVSLREGYYVAQGTRDERVEIVVIDLPHISNFTDIDPLYFEPDVMVRFVDAPENIGTPDAIIIPGSKNVAGDLDHLRSVGVDQAVVEFGKAGGAVIGICGGYQILGRSLADPHGLETEAEVVPGLGLIGIDTVLEREKTLTRRSGTHLESGLTVSGYEIHHGITKGGSAPVIEFAEGDRCGEHNERKTVWGAYLHGIFDEDHFRRWFIDQLRIQKGLAPIGRVLAPYDLDKNIDELADVVRGCFAMDRIYQLVGY